MAWSRRRPRNLQAVGLHQGAEGDDHGRQAPARRMVHAVGRRSHVQEDADGPRAWHAKSACGSYGYGSASWAALFRTEVEAGPGIGRITTAKIGSNVQRRPRADGILFTIHPRTVFHFIPRPPWSYRRPLDAASRRSTGGLGRPHRIRFDGAALGTHRDRTVPNGRRSTGFGCSAAMAAPLVVARKAGTKDDVRRCQGTMAIHFEGFRLIRLPPALTDPSSRADARGRPGGEGRRLEQC